MPRIFFEEIAEALIGFLPRDLRAFESRRGGRNLKIWYEDPREHYEVQIVSAGAVRPRNRRGRGPVIEIGFHAEHPAAEANEATLAEISAVSLRKSLGTAPERGDFFGARQTAAWRRISEVWTDGTADPDTAIEAAERLASYIRAIEPLRRARKTSARPRRRT